MKSAVEWIAALRHIRFISASDVEAIQADAYRAGMSEAADEVRLLSPGTKSEERAIAFDEAIMAILSARDRKGKEGV